MIRPSPRPRSFPNWGLAATRERPTNTRRNFMLSCGAEQDWRQGEGDGYFLSYLLHFSDIQFLRQYWLYFYLNLLAPWSNRDPANQNFQIPQILKCLKDPTCDIFEKRGIQGYQIWQSRVSNVKYTNTQKHKYANTQILLFLSHVIALAVDSISSSHSKISAICSYHFFVLIFIPLDGAVIDGDMLSIVLSTFLII